MALFKCSIQSQALGQRTNINVILPLPSGAAYTDNLEKLFPQEGQKYPVLYLLHGFTADYSDWGRSSGIERYACEHKLAVVMPSGANSFYNNLPAGGSYYDYYTRELPEIVRRMFPVSADPKYNYIAGLSMGGFGAMKAALNNPEKYNAVVSLSGALRELNPAAAQRMPGPVDTYESRCAAYGVNGEYYNSETDDLRLLLEKAAAEKTALPRMYIACGTEDFLYRANVEMRDYITGLNLPLTYEEGPGVHNWDFWDPFIRRAIEWLDVPGTFVN